MNNFIYEEVFHGVADIYRRLRLTLGRFWLNRFNWNMKSVKQFQSDLMNKFRTFFGEVLVPCFLYKNIVIDDIPSL